MRRRGRLSQRGGKSPMEDVPWVVGGPGWRATVCDSALMDASWLEGFLEDPSGRRVGKEDTMLSSRMSLCSILMLVLLSGGASLSAAPTVEEAVNLIASRLDQEQVKDGLDAGAWPLEMYFTGPIAAGMVCAYERTEDPAYLASAHLAGQWIFDTAAVYGALLGDETYAFTRLSELSEDPNENPWRDAVVDFFLSHRNPDITGTTEEYLRVFEELEPSTATYHIAYLLVAADYVQDADVDIYRQALLRYLSGVDDKADFPVMALGVATWALIATDTPAETLVASDDAVPNSYWEGLTVGDLPELLAGHQVPEGEVLAGSFYWRFDHTDGGTEGVIAGYTEDTIFGTLGLIAAALKDPEGAGEPADLAIAAAEQALLSGIDEDGLVYLHLAMQGPTYNAFAGEMLQALWSVEEYWDWRAEMEMEMEAEVVAEQE